MNPIKFSRALTLVGYFSLMIGIYVWHILINKTDEQLMAIILLVQAGPLLFPLRGLLHGKTYTHAWSIYLAIFYFIIGVWYAGAEEARMFGLYIIATSLMFLVGTGLYTRLSARMNSGD